LVFKKLHTGCVGVDDHHIHIPIVIPIHLGKGAAISHGIGPTHKRAIGKLPFTRFRGL
jgi:hypothetical protein